jgi:glutaconate CoA-transferase, subunit A
VCTWRRKLDIVSVKKLNRTTGRRDGVAEIVSLAEAITGAVHDGDTVAMEGFTHLIPHAAGREVIRQRRRDLTLVRMTPDVIYDQMIGAGCARKLVFSWGGNPGVGTLHRFRDAIEHDWPVPLEIEEHSHAGMANRYVAGASGLPFAVLRGYSGTGLVTTATNTRANIAEIVCPFTGDRLTAVAALRPDVTVIHAQRADRAGNVQLWGITGVQKEAVLAAARSVVTVEEIVDELDPRPGAIVLPAWAVGYVALAPGGAHPSYALDYTIRDNDFYVAWDAISRDREAFARWLDEHVYGEAAS